MLVSEARAAKSPTTTTASSSCRPTRRSARAFAKYAGLDDPVIEINLTPNRPDCTGVNGIARDLAAADIGTFKDRRAEAGEGRIPLPGLGDARLRPDAIRSARRSRCGSCAASRTARRRSGCRSGSRRSGCARSTRWSTSPTSSPTTAAGRCTCSTPTKVKGNLVVRRAQERRAAAGARRQDLHARRRHVRDRRRQRRRSRSPASWAARRRAATRPPPTC